TMIDDSNTQAVNGQAYYQPAVFRDSGPHTSGNFQYNLIESPFKPRTAFILPIYIGSLSNINSVSLTFDGESMEDPVTVTIPQHNLPGADCSAYTSVEAQASNGGGIGAGYASGVTPASNGFEAGRWCVTS